jgi:hypothetical protein
MNGRVHAPREAEEAVDLLSEPEGLVGLSEALIALREELLAAWQEGETGGTGSRRIRFRVPEPIELTFQTAVTKKVGANAGVKWWLLSLGGEASRDSQVTQTLQLKLAPVMYDAETGDAVDVVEIDSPR